MKTVAFWSALLAAAYAFAADTAEKTRQTWHLYGMALLSDQKTLVVTRMLPIGISGATPEAMTARAEVAKAKFKQLLTQHITTRMYREVVSVATVAGARRTDIRDQRDAEINTKKAGGMRIIFLNGFNFSFDDQD